MPLTDTQRILRQKAHALKPVVTLGQKGLTPTVLTEVLAALACHELIKIKLPLVDKAQRQDIANTLLDQTAAQFVGLLGRTLTLYKKAPKK